MGKLKNEFLANTKVTFSSGEVHFDEKGIAEVEPDELYQEVLQIPNFYAVNEEGETVPKEEPKKEATEEEETEEKEEPKKPKAPTIDPDDYKEKELDEKAKELEIPEEDYPKSGTKAVKAAAINAFLAENN